MDKFLGFKTEEIITCLLLIVVGYAIAKMFSGCGCANKVNGFSVGGAFGGGDCGGPYDATDPNTYCQFQDDASLLYKCNSEDTDACNSFTNGVCSDSNSPYFGLQQNKCPSMNQPPNMKIRSRDNSDRLQHLCGDTPNYLSNHRDLMYRGGDTINGPPNYVNNVWEGSDRCIEQAPAPSPPTPNPPPPPPASDKCRTVSGLGPNWREDKEDYMTNSCSHDQVYVNAKNNGQDVLCCVNDNECVGDACRQENMESTIENRGKNVCTRSTYNNISGKFPGPNTKDEYDNRPVNCWYISDTDSLWSNDDCDETNIGDTKGHGLGCYYLDGDAPPPQPTNECDIAVANQWKNIICDTKINLDKNGNKNHTYKTINKKLSQIKVNDAEMSPPLSPFSFDHKDIGQMGCNKYTNSKYCIQGVQGTATCKAKDESSKADDKTCRTLLETNCNTNSSCVWRIPNLMDENFEELSEQPGACSRKCSKPLDEGEDCPITDLLPQTESLCNTDPNLLWCSNSNTGNSILGELPINQIIGNNYSELNTYCQTNDYKPLNPNNAHQKGYNNLRDLRHKRNMLRDELSLLETQV